MPRRARKILALSALVAAFAALPAGGAAAAQLYLPDYGSGPPNVIRGFEVAADGSLSPIAGSPFPSTAVGAPVSGIFGMGFGPTGDRAAAAFLFDGGAQGYGATPAGALAPAGSPVETPSATGLAVSPDGRFAYTGTRDFGGDFAVGIVGYSIASDGGLTPLPSSPFDNGEFGDIAITPAGQFLYAAKPGGTIEGFAITGDGTLTSLGLTPVPSAATLASSPDGRFLFVSNNLGVRSFTIGADGFLTQNGEPALTEDNGLAHFAVSSDGRHIYMPDANLDGVVTATVADDGSLSVVNTMTVEDVESAAASPDRRLLYISDTDDIQVASIGPDGVPSLLPGSTPAPTGEPNRLVFRPQPAPVASFTTKKRAPGTASRFDATASARAARYDWDFGDGSTLANGGPTPRHTYRKAGKYTVTLRVTDAQGCGANQVYTGQSTVCPGGASTIATARLDTPPALKRLEAKPKRFEVAGRRSRAKAGSTIFRYRLSERAKVRIKIQRKDGRRYVTEGRIKTSGKKGKNKTPFSGKLPGGALEPGRYRATAVATDPARGKSPRKRTSFQVVSG